MSIQGISKLSYNELRKLAEDALALANSKRAEEIKVLADAYTKKRTAAGFSIEEAIEALKPYWPKKGKASFTYEVKYHDPENAGNTYGGRGKRPDWLRKYLEQGRTLEEFAV